MNVKVTNSGIFVTLSKRNLETLLSKLNRDNSERMLIRHTEDGQVLYVKAEPDEEHYKDREPGKVHPSDEPWQVAA